MGKNKSDADYLGRVNELLREAKQYADKNPNEDQTELAEGIKQGLQEINTAFIEKLTLPETIALYKKINTITDSSANQMEEFEQEMGELDAALEQANTAQAATKIQKMVRGRQVRKEKTTTEDELTELDENFLSAVNQVVNNPENKEADANQIFTLLNDKLVDFPLNKLTSQHAQALYDGITKQVSSEKFAELLNKANEAANQSNHKLDLKSINLNIENPAAKEDETRTPTKTSDNLTEADYVKEVTSLSSDEINPDHLQRIITKFQGVNLTDDTTKNTFNTMTNIVNAAKQLQNEAQYDALINDFLHNALVNNLPQQDLQKPTSSDNNKTLQDSILSLNQDLETLKARSSPDATVTSNTNKESIHAKSHDRNNKDTKNSLAAMKNELFALKPRSTSTSATANAAATNKASDNLTEADYVKELNNLDLQNTFSFSDIKKLSEINKKYESVSSKPRIKDLYEQASKLEKIANNIYGGEETQGFVANEKIKKSYEKALARQFHTYDESLENTDTLVNTKNKNGKTPLMIAISRELTNIEELLNIEEPLNKEPDVNQQDKNGKTALMYAAQMKDQNTVKLLINKKADVNKQNNKGKTALIYAVEAGDIDSADLLIKNGADVNKQDNNGNTALMYAAAKGYQNGVELLIVKGADVDLHNNDGKTALMYAVEQNNFNVFDLLINNKANLNLKDNDGKTALMYAVELGDVTSTELLIKNRADVNLPDKDKKTALMYAAEKGYQQGVELLIENGADFNLRDNAGKTAFDYAVNNNYHDLAKIIDKKTNNIAESQILTTSSYIDRAVAKQIVDRINPDNSSIFNTALNTPLISAIQDIKTSVKLDNIGIDDIIPQNTLQQIQKEITNSKKFTFSSLVTSTKNKNEKINAKIQATVIAFIENRIAALPNEQKAREDNQENDRIKKRIDDSKAAWQARNSAATHDNDVTTTNPLNNQHSKAKTNTTPITDPNPSSTAITHASQNNSAIAQQTPKPPLRDFEIVRAFRNAYEQFHIDQLFKNGYDINTQNPYGITALMTAVEEKDNNAVQLLLNNGAKVDIKALDDRTALTIANQHRRTDIIPLLNQHAPDEKNERKVDTPAPTPTPAANPTATTAASTVVPLNPTAPEAGSNGANHANTKVVNTNPSPNEKNEVKKQEQSATKIQKVFRGHQGRKAYKNAQGNAADALSETGSTTLESSLSRSSSASSFKLVYDHESFNLDDPRDHPPAPTVVPANDATVASDARSDISHTTDTDSAEWKTVTSSSSQPLSQRSSHSTLPEEPKKGLKTSSRTSDITDNESLHSSSSSEASLEKSFGGRGKGPHQITTLFDEDHQNISNTPPQNQNRHAAVTASTQTPQDASPPYANQEPHPSYPAEDQDNEKAQPKRSIWTSIAIGAGIGIFGGPVGMIAGAAIGAIAHKYGEKNPKKMMGGAIAVGALLGFAMGGPIGLVIGIALGAGLGSIMKNRYKDGYNNAPQDKITSTLRKELKDTREEMRGLKQEIAGQRNTPDKDMEGLKKTLSKNETQTAPNSAATPPPTPQSSHAKREGQQK